MLIKPKPNLHETLPDGRTHPSVSLETLYVVVTVLSDEFRIVDDTGEPILVPRSRFEVVDDEMPSEWLREVDADEGWFWCGPHQFAVPGFFERWHDGSEVERRMFACVYGPIWRQYEQRLHGQQMILKQ